MKAYPIKLILAYVFLCTTACIGEQNEQHPVVQFVEHHGEESFDEFRGYVCERGMNQWMPGKTVVNVWDSHRKIRSSAFVVDNKSYEVISKYNAIPTDTNGVPVLRENEISEYGKLASKFVEYGLQTIGVTDTGTVHLTLNIKEENSLYRMPEDQAKSWFGKQSKDYIVETVKGWYWVRKRQDQCSTSTTNPPPRGAEGSGGSEASNPDPSSTTPSTPGSARAERKIGK